MKTIKYLTIIAVTMSVLGAPLAGFAADQASSPTPDKLTTCPVSGDKLGEMGKPFVFEYKGQEVKLCCKNCKKDFEKAPETYIKKIRAADSADAGKPSDKQ